jgi:hypothetical protein
MEIPVLERQVAEKKIPVLKHVSEMEESEIPLLRQYDIPPEIEPVTSPKPEKLDIPQYPEDYAEKTVHGVEYIAYKGHWYVSGTTDGRVW